MTTVPPDVRVPAPTASVFGLPTTLIIGTGTIRTLSEHVRNLDVHKPLIVSDPGVAHTDSFSVLTASLESAGITYGYTLEVEPQPTVNNVLRAAETYRAEHCDGVVALGGGSAIDTAKGVAILATNDGRPEDYHGTDLYHIPPAPLIAIPTTAGTGSEVSYAAPIRDAERDKKLTIRHIRFNPARIAILDPQVLRSLPPKPAALAGMDALSHAIESYTSREATVLTEALSLQAIEMIAANIQRFIADRDDLEAGERMLVGSTLAGIGFSYAGTGNAHCLARTLAGTFHMEHGMSCAVTLPHVVAHNVLAAPARYARVAAALGQKIAGFTDREAAAKAAPALFSLTSELNLPHSLRPFGIEPRHVDYIAQESITADYSRWNPRNMTEHNFEALVKEML